MADHQWRLAVTSPASVRIASVDASTVAIIVTGGGYLIDVRVPADATWLLEDLGLPDLNDGPAPAALDEPAPPAAPEKTRELDDPDDDDIDEPDEADPELAAHPDVRQLDEPPRAELVGDLPHETPGPRAAAPVDAPTERWPEPTIALNPAVDRPSCGTRSGARQHRIHGEQLCVDCEIADDIDHRAGLSAL